MSFGIAIQRRFAGVLIGMLTMGAASNAFGTTILYGLIRGGNGIGQIYRSADSAKTWQQTSLSSVAFAVDPKNPNMIYSLVRSTAKKSTNTGGPAILRSTDGGQTYTPTDFNGAAPIAVDSTMSNILYAAGGTSPGGVFRSTDSGATWTQTSLAGSLRAIRTDPAAPGVVLAVMSTTTNTIELDKSTDYGVTWTLAGTGFGYTLNLAQPPQPQGTASDVALDGNNPSTVYIAGSGSCGTTGTTHCVLPRSTDGGKTWQTTAMLGNFGNVEIDPRSGNIFAGGLTTISGKNAGEVIRSSDGGKTWTSFTNGLLSHGAQVHIDPESSSILYANQWSAYADLSIAGGVFVSTDGGQSWTLSQVVSQLPPGTQLYEFDVVSLQAVSDSHPALFAGEVPLSAGVYYLTFPDTNVFGYYTYVTSSILYHYDMGYEAFVPGSSNDAYLYDFTAGHWLYTSATLFPYLYDFTLNSWLYYLPDTKNAGHYTTSPRYFSNLTTGKIITM